MRFIVLADDTHCPLSQARVIDVPDEIAVDIFETSLCITGNHVRTDLPRDLLAPTITEVKDALEGDSNDAEHDALVSVAELLNIDYRPSED